MSPAQRLDALIEATGKLKAGVARATVTNLLLDELGGMFVKIAQVVSKI